ncbi:hypothetical protein [Mycobacterium avium]|uniref:hypothetical protein n=1 Tax=Mycobacterium avium TaxID=1764 RepID=UPI000BAFD852|nr:hypothetical protein [Mycobacterium avium]PBA68860.1 hypothetical protein CKJ76_25910 [Mycobacterium avium]
MTVGGPDDGVTAITRERTRQQTIGSVTHAQGAWHRPKELIDAALAYTVQAQDLLSAANGQGVGADSPDTYWPWDIKAFKRSDDEFRSLAKAGAFLAAAYDAALACRGGSGGIGPVPGAIARRPDGGNIALREEEDDGTRYWKYAYEEGGDDADEWELVLDPTKQD